MGLEDYKPTIILIGCQLMYSSVTVTGKAAILQDMSPRVFVAYRQFIAFLLIAPFAFFTRKGITNQYSLGWKNFWLIFLLSFFGVSVNQNIYFEGLYLASSSAGSALINLVPAITFVMAYTLGLEKVNLRSWRSVAKIIGTVFCVSGAVVMAFIKGPKLLNNIESQPLDSIFLQGGGDTWLLGCLLLFGSACCWSIWFILQAQITVSYDNPISLATWTCFFATIQSAVLALIFEPNMNAWKMDIALGIFCCFLAGGVSAITVFGQAWCIARRGPLFSAMFNPLGTVIVTVLACIFLHEDIYIGSLIGALAVIFGLYIVLWGKAKDHDEMKDETSQTKNQIDQTTILCSQVSDNASGQIDLEEPLLSGKSAHYKKCTVI